MTAKPLALVTNDDGIDSVFLHKLVEALLPMFKVAVAAPAFEQSWIGRAVSRREEVEVIASPSYFPESVSAWAISGTPTDCVNIALGHLVTRQPDIVISGINIGFNTTETLILCSGTVAGAIEGANWGLPAVAFSKCVPGELFEAIRDSKGQTEGEYKASLECATTTAARLSRELLAHPEAPGTVVNVNFPHQTKPGTEIEESFPAKIRLGSFYQPSRPGHYSFRYSDGVEVDPHPRSDRAVLQRGGISRSVLDFSRICRLREQL
ncbi:5'/3'-nucleotidase SurE [Coraliomargarita parva]|uniref:5'/3'-nucleotidase SurE n=1 Tax=Coraliomargarita parva TaxID=3014050 RepID=UPI0022B2C730|nr:5'/3'-nucleotidase SurE [Coraliomargarita parva]